MWSLYVPNGRKVDDPHYVLVDLASSRPDAGLRPLLESVLHRVKGNQTHAAEMLGISLKTLYNRLEEYGAAGEIDESSSSSLR